MAEKRYQCFVCCGITTRKNSKDNSVKSDTSLLSKNLDVIFFLKKLLKVPTTLLVNQLKECGQDPEDWLKLCDHCNHLTKRAKELDMEIRKIEKEFSCVQKHVVEKFINSRCAQKGRILKKFHENVKSFVRTRKF